MLRPFIQPPTVVTRVEGPHKGVRKPEDVSVRQIRSFCQTSLDCVSREMDT